MQAFVSAGFGGVLGTAILQHFIKVLNSKNFMLLSSGIDHVNHRLMQVDMGALFGKLQEQVLLVSFKESYGYLVIAALACLLLFILYKYPYYPKFTLYPDNRAIRKFLRKEMV